MTAIRGFVPPTGDKDAFGVTMGMATVVSVWPLVNVSVPVVCV